MGPVAGSLFMNDYIVVYGRARKSSECLQIAHNLGSIDKRIEEDKDWPPRKGSGVNATTSSDASEGSAEKDVEQVEVVREKARVYTPLTTLRF